MLKINMQFIWKWAYFLSTLLHE